MRALWVAPLNIHLEPTIASLESLGEHRIAMHWFDRHGLPSDRAVLDAFDRTQPELVIYTGSNHGPFVPSTDTLLRLRQKVPTVFMCHDGSDTTWEHLLHEYRERDVFTVTVNIDGNDEWEKGPRDFTALTPTSPEFFLKQIPLLERPIKFAFAGGYASPSRREIVEYLAEHAGMVIPQRNETYGSYRSYAEFLGQVQILLNVPYSGSDNSCQVKGRVLEAGWAGCMLLDHEKSASRHWFAAGIDYDTYQSREQAVGNVAWLQGHPETMLRMSTSLQRIVRSAHSPAAFWRKVFERTNNG